MSLSAFGLSDVTVILTSWRPLSAAGVQDEAKSDPSCADPLPFQYVIC